MENFAREIHSRRQSHQTFRQKGTGVEKKAKTITKPISL